ncbi:MBL fold metallo-hydrolase [Streptomyces sp. DSM 41014]|uniref:MBL fold metallo-hydrolase n=1 Tax=Streptomyces hintoniae TaxID=3075521 RepID=A0ABU2UHM7_9ACTN|nr:MULTISPECIES: MBL fold metallo-hydrolase [unclassified Streptomyces]MDH6696614.1 L-ascorbate metabolism protein UlaG (beta-lactamase superfamily) [Streptomyces sp. MAA16]MDT0472709.1 MBL fold metallo-hydrolase [Streptomyces sp. DSM 41014]
MSGFRSLSSGLSSLQPAAFGADPSGERMARIRRSPHFKDGVFQNPGGTARTRPSGSAKSLAKVYIDKETRARRAPQGTVPVHATTLADIAAPPADGLRLTWMGHSSVLAEIDGQRVLFDPVWGERCSPFPFAGPKRLHPVPLPLAALGPVDVVVISHDHYDHLDMPTIKALAGTDTLFAVPLGVGAHLEHWGVSADRLRELDWHEATRVGDLTLTATPARHFCGRGLRNTQHTLWASWAVAGPEHRVYHSGDTGYFEGFKDIGAAHGPFDATMIQIGAYSDFWPDIHMTPEEGMRAHLDLQGGEPRGVMLPIHWGTFNLAPHPWAEPGEGTLAAARATGSRVALPHPGQPFEPTSETVPADPWWRGVALAPAGGWPESDAGTPDALTDTVSDVQGKNSTGTGEPETVQAG